MPHSDDWSPDVLGDGYTQLTMQLGADPDDEGDAVATLVRYAEKPATVEPGFAVLYVHGYTDYFFQKHMAEHFAAQGHQFFALDLRKCGRSRRPGQSPHYVSDLSLYDAELNESLRIISELTNGTKIVVVGHSTGGLIVSLWLDRLNRAQQTASDGGVVAAGIVGVILNSPWFDLQGPAYLRSLATNMGLRAASRWRSRAIVPTTEADSYGVSLHSSWHGEWDYNLEWKPLTGFPVRAGWIYAIRKGQATLHKGLDIGIPALILRSKVTKFMKVYGPEIDFVDAVLDVKQIQRWAGCLGDRTTIVPIENARHDVYLSAPDVRARAFAETDSWLDWLAGYQNRD